MLYHDSDYNWEAFKRRQQIEFDGISCYIASPEDLFISKLIWYNISKSGKQWEDFEFLLTLTHLDKQYIEQWTSKLFINRHANIEENIKASRASDLLYAKWYAAQPNERKSNMILSGYNLVANNVEHQVKKENPFATNADVILRFIEISHKADVSDETFDFVTKQMTERSEKE